MTSVDNPNSFLKLALMLGCTMLSGCAQLLCQSGPLQQELRTLETEFYEVQGNLDRGYAIHVRHERRTEPYSETEEYCAAHDSAGKCTLVGSRTVTKYRKVLHSIEEPVAIDVPSSRERADYLWGRIQSVSGPAEQEYAECLARNG